MISLKRYLQRNQKKLPAVFTGAYLTIVETMVAGALRSCPSTGETLKRELSIAVEPLRHEHTAGSFKSAQQKALNSLRSWGEHSETYFTRKTHEIKEILTELARTAEAIGERDKRYTLQFHDLTSNLQTIAELDDITRIKTSVLRSAGELKSCVDRMVREGVESVAHLEASLASHRVALEQAQELATLDLLTGLYNRREVEARLGQRISTKTPFCVVIIDLNNFKQINDRHGHAAGDEVLRQMASELRMASRTQDTLGRWGGDKFVMVIDGSCTSARVKVQRMRPWVFGAYELNMGAKKLNVVVNATIGVAEWSLGETLLQVLTHADEDMTRDERVNPTTRTGALQSG